MRLSKHSTEHRGYEIITVQLEIKHKKLIKLYMKSKASSSKSCL